MQKKERKNTVFTNINFVTLIVKLLLHCYVTTDIEITINLNSDYANKYRPVNKYIYILCYTLTKSTLPSCEIFS